MKKDNKLTKFVVFVLLITLLALVLVSNTYAKYTSSKDLSATATVAKWSIKLKKGDNNYVDMQETTFNLFAHNDANVDSTKIAPGTTGSVAITIKNESEVKAKYEITFEELSNDNNIPLEFSTDNSDWKKDINELKPSQELAIGEEKPVTIYWRWAFEGKDSTNFQADQTDLKDTALGTAATTESVPTAKVTAKLIATQVD